MKMIHWKLDQERYPNIGVNSFIILLCYVVSYDVCLCLFMLPMLSKKIIKFMCLQLVDGRNSPSVNWESGTGPGLSK
jgi:hypothetical protein